MKRILMLLAGLFIAVLTLSGCQNAVQRADTVDHWHQIERRKTVIVGMDDSFVPMGFRQRDNKIVGFDVDLARAVFNKYGIRVDFQPIDWTMNVTELRNGTIDLIWNGYSKTPERERVVAFSQPYLQNSQVLVTKKASHINRFSDMTGKALGVQNGSSGLNDLNAQPKVLLDKIQGQKPILYDAFTQAFIDLNAGRIQGLLIDKTYADYYISHLKDSASYQELTGPFPPESFAVGMRKGDRTLQRKINEGLDQLKADGEMQQIQAKWFGHVDQKK